MQKNVNLATPLKNSNSYTRALKDGFQTGVWAGKDKNNLFMWKYFCNYFALTSFLDFYVLFYVKAIVLRIPKYFVLTPDHFIKQITLGRTVHSNQPSNQLLYTCNQANNHASNQLTLSCAPGRMYATAGTRNRFATTMRLSLVAGTAGFKVSTSLTVTLAEPVFIPSNKT